ncbi:aminoglycoside phosphotransferase family protein [Streptomyces lichenis]|uniref:Aminoglycoside phosphotransferase family protein n=1 Tax=Streptomyces lichenis TaxID=2306967 RepID=A0ABT0IG84_9ACTN|nr:aminoglycoside phosphotransferase family protein [Streptomyces lichenis]MCK8680337.1 aminoglycoside phosphotransferase family protein [Streptomyces lichenis]
MTLIGIPEALVSSYARAFGESGRAWLARVPALAGELLERWGLERDGEPMYGEAALVLPVLRRGDGDARAVLRLQLPREETTAAIVGLRAWGGRGAVRLLDHDPESSAMLLERLEGGRTLASVEDDDLAMGTLAGLLARLVAVPAPPGLRGLDGIASEMVEQAPAAMSGLAAPEDRRRLRGWAAAVAELVGEAGGGTRLLHWDLHYGNVLAAEREPWLAIDPEPLAGDPGFDLWPALDSRWDEVVVKGGTARVVRRRFDLLTEVLGLDRARAAGWTRGRLLQNALWDIEDGRTALDPAAVALDGALPGG